MSSIVQQAWEVVATDDTCLGLVADGAAGLLGGDESAPTPAANAPWGYLGRGLDTPVNLSPSPLVNGTTALDSELEWWLYDALAERGYTQLRLLAVAITRAYAAARRAPRPAGQRCLWSDPDTGERVYWLGAGTRWESADEHLGNLIRVRFPFRYTYAGQWP